MFDDVPGQRRVKICCGPRCGVVPGHRRLYDAVEKAANEAGAVTRPTMCQGLCGDGVTVVLPNGDTCKVRNAEDAAAVTILAQAEASAPEGAYNSNA